MGFFRVASKRKVVAKRKFLCEINEKKRKLSLLFSLERSKISETDSVSLYFASYIFQSSVCGSIMQFLSKMCRIYANVFNEWLNYFDF